MKNIDDILKQALTPTEKPDFWVNQNILSKAKEAHQMKQKKLKTMAAAALSAALILGIGSLTIYAARKFLLPEHIAEEIKDPKLAAAFKSKDAVSINETQSYGGYDVTLMGMVSGKSISEFLVSDGNEVHDDRTYAVMAIEKSDMSPMPSTSDDSYSAFFASPLIEGLNPAFYNAFTFQGTCIAMEKDGILYHILDCDNIEYFADRSLYFCVLEGSFYNSEAYTFDEATGHIARNEDFDGLNALFSLPLDPKKADPDKAAEYLKQIDEGQNADEPKDEPTDLDREVEAFMETITPENLPERATPIEKSRQTAMPGENGKLEFSYQLEEGSGSKSTDIDSLFPEKKPGTTVIDGYSYEDSLSSLLISAYTLNEDGSVTFIIYKPNEIQPK